MIINTLADLIGFVESDNNYLAVRYEPLYTANSKYATIMQRIAECNVATAKILCAMSWGRYQIMGSNLIIIGLMISPLAYVNNQYMQDIYFDDFISPLNQNGRPFALDDILGSKVARQRFASFYNGPGNVDAYVERMETIARQNGLRVMG